MNDHSVLVKATKKILAKFFLPQKNPGIKNFKPQNPSIISVTKIPEYLHWGFVPPQISLSKVLLMTYFITARQIVDYEAESQISTSKKETTTNGKRTKYLLFFGNRNTLNWKSEAPSTPVKMPAINYNGVGYLESNVCLGEGRVWYSFKFLAPYIEKLYSIVVFAKFSCGTYVIVVLNSDIVALINKQNVLLLARWFLAWFCWICGVTEFGIPLPNAILIFEHAYNSTTRLVSIVWCGAQLRV